MQLTMTDILIIVLFTKRGRLKQIIGHVYPSEEEQQEVLEKLQSTQHDKQVFFYNNVGKLPEKILFVSNW